MSQNLAQVETFSIINFTFGIYISLVGGLEPLSQGWENME